MNAEDRWSRAQWSQDEAPGSRWRGPWSSALRWLAVALVVVLFARWSGAEEVLAQLADADPWWLAASAAAALGSYVFLTVTHVTAGRPLGCSLGLWPAFRVVLTSAVVNHFLAGAGASTVAVRVHLLSRAGVPVSQGLSLSGLAAAASNLALTLLLVVSVAALARGGQLSSTELLLCSLVPAAVGGATLLALAAGLREDWRARLLRASDGVLRRAWRAVRGKRAEKRRQPGAPGFVEDLERALARLDRPVSRLTALGVHALVSWLLALVCLGCAFRALGEAPAASTLLAGLLAGSLTAFTGFLPGSVGILEGSMAGVFTHFGVPLPASIGAVVLYRATYYVIPGLLSALAYAAAPVRPGTLAAEPGSGDLAA